MLEVRRCQVVEVDLSRLLDRTEWDSKKTDPKIPTQTLQGFGDLCPPCRHNLPETSMEVENHRFVEENSLPRGHVPRNHDCLCIWQFHGVSGQQVLSFTWQVTPVGHAWVYRSI